MVFDAVYPKDEQMSSGKKVKIILLVTVVLLISGTIVAILGSQDILPVNSMMVMGLTFILVTIFICCGTLLITGSIAQKMPEYSRLEEKFREAMKYYENSEWVEALEIFRELMGPKMDHKRALYYAARCSENLDHWEDVKIYLQHYLEMQPKDREAWELLAKAHKRLFEYVEAEKAMEQASKLKPRGS